MKIMVYATTRTALILELLPDKIEKEDTYFPLESYFAIIINCNWK